MFNIPKYKQEVSDFEEGLMYGYPPICISNFNHEKCEYDYKNKNLSEFENFLIEEIREDWKIYTDEGLKQSIMRSYEIYQTLSKYREYHDIMGINEWMEPGELTFLKF